MRREARELALQLLFQYECDKDFEMPATLARFATNFNVPRSVIEYGQPLLEGVIENLKELDAIIQNASPHWKVQRMGTVDRNTLRIAVFELLHRADEIPPKVAINEAIEVGRKFGNTDSASFINGILDAIAKNNDINL